MFLGLILRFRQKNIGFPPKCLLKILKEIFGKPLLSYDKPIYDNKLIKIGIPDYLAANLIHQN